jgi:hypothetical protein
MTSNEKTQNYNIVDLDETYDFLVLNFFHLRSLRCSKNNWIFKHEGIFDFSYPRFNTVRVKSEFRAMVPMRA